MCTKTNGEVNPWEGCHKQFFIREEQLYSGEDNVFVVYETAIPTEHKFIDTKGVEQKFKLQSKTPLGWFTKQEFAEFFMTCISAAKGTKLT